MAGSKTKKISYFGIDAFNKISVDWKQAENIEAASNNEKHAGFEINIARKAFPLMRSYKCVNDSLTSVWNYNLLGMYKISI